MLGYVQLLGPWYADVASQANMNVCVGVVSVNVMGNNMRGPGPEDEDDDGGCDHDRGGG